MRLEDYLIGRWTNRSQAQSNPHTFASVEIIWKEVEGGYESMNFKRCIGPEDPYRKKRHTIEYISETEAIVHNHHLDWTPHPDCDIMFKLEDKVWIGGLMYPGICRGYRGDRVVSVIRAYGNKLHTMDQGYDQNDKLVWGSTELYRFTRTRM